MKRFIISSFLLMLLSSLFFSGCSADVETSPVAGTYMVVFNSNNGSDSRIYGPQFFTEGKSQALTSYRELAFVRNGYTFAGWAESPNAVEVQYEDAAIFTAKSNITLYAVWTVCQYTLTYVYNNGTDNLVISDVEYGSSIEPPADPIKTGYTFTGWDQTIPATMPADNLIITATWTVNQYTYTFVHTEGLVTTTIATVTQDYGTAFTAPSAEKEGYSYTWVPALPETIGAEDMIFTAVYTVNKYTVTFDYGNGQENYSYQLDYGSTITPPADPIKTGYIFAGWDQTIPATMPAQDLTITAQYTPNDYTIQIVVVCPWGSNEFNQTITQAYGTVIPAVAAPAHEGYTFMGWNTPIPETMPVLENGLTITGIMQINNHSITYQLDNGEDDIVQNYNYGQTIQPPADPVKENYYFNGWSSQIPNSMPDQDITVTAQWLPSAKVSIISIHQGGGDVEITAQDLTLTAHPTVSGNYTYEWLLDDVKQNCTGESFTVDPESVEIGGYYTVTVSAISESGIVYASSIQVTIVK